MPEHPQFIASALHRYSETLRRQLYDAVVQHLWTPLHPGDYVPDFTPDAAQLQIEFRHGRWIVTYVDLEAEADAPPDQRAVMSRIHAAPDRPFGIQLSEV